MTGLGRDDGEVWGGWKHRLEIFYDLGHQLALREVRERNDGSLRVRRKENSRLTQLFAFFMWLQYLLNWVFLLHFCSDSEA